MNQNVLFKKNYHLSPIVFPNARNVFTISKTTLQHPLINNMPIHSQYIQ